MRLLVCGGRRFDDKERAYGVLDALHQVRPIAAIIHGDATGADTLADKWADERGIERHPYPAMWEVHGSRAGPIRNAMMLRDGRPDAILAFPGGTGTADMVRRAREAGVEVIEIRA